MKLNNKLVTLLKNILLIVSSFTILFTIFGYESKDWNHGVPPAYRKLQKELLPLRLLLDTLLHLIQYKKLVQKSTK